MRYNFFISNSVVSIEIPAFVKNINVKLFEYAWFIDFHEAIEDLKSMGASVDHDTCISAFDRSDTGIEILTVI